MGFLIGARKVGYTYPDNLDETELGYPSPTTGEETEEPQVEERQQEMKKTERITEGGV